MPTVAGRTDPQVTAAGQVCDLFEGGGVEDHHPTVVGDRQTRGGPALLGRTRVLGAVGITLVMPGAGRRRLLRRAAAGEKQDRDKGRGDVTGMHADNK
ncbi:lipid-A-disaccharide synthase [Mycolicibacterium brisbanense]|uniref:Lipid-A-disaccharide synthase n=1 Tax=Mycolicibacterium brisbanense TaxID=146020 RepID=A0A100VWK5_9MYCO|nr:lipid-A-disaccharide synthase [Mycolicibacterium brisbanense]